MVISVSDRLRKALHSLGLTDYEIRVYLTLLERGSMTANQVSEAADVPYSKIYEVLEGLEKKGWIGSEGGRPAKFYSRSPITALEVNRMRIERKLKTYENIVASELIPLYESGGLRERHDIWILRGKLNILSKLKDLLASCDLELQIATPWIDKQLVDMLLPTLTILKTKGGTIQIMLSSSCSRSIARKLSDYAEVRFRNQLFGGGVIADSKEAIILLRSENGEPALAIWSDHIGLARIAKVYFEYLWKDAEPLKDR
ncbi:MAG: TrmB family transcriptional regulator [Aigarchaeota archaeon]|nr:TrmB family transcriptional regulator [Aigarchaeota archaeon]